MTDSLDAQTVRDALDAAMTQARITGYLATSAKYGRALEAHDRLVASVEALTVLREAAEAELAWLKKKHESLTARLEASQTYLTEEFREWVREATAHSDTTARLLSLEEALRGLCENAEPIASHYGPHSHKRAAGLIVAGCPFCDLSQAVTAARDVLAASVGGKA